MADVLLCDDDAEAAELLRERLAAYGLQTYVVSSVEQALGYLRTFACEAIVTKVRLGDGEASQVLVAAMRRAPRARRITIGANPSSDAQILADCALPARYSLGELLVALEGGQA